MLMKGKLDRIPKKIKQHMEVVSRKKKSHVSFLLRNTNSNTALCCPCVVRIISEICRCSKVNIQFASPTTLLVKVHMPYIMF